MCIPLLSKPFSNEMKHTFTSYRWNLVEWRPEAASVYVMAIDVDVHCTLYVRTHPIDVKWDLGHD